MKKTWPMKNLFICIILILGVFFIIPSVSMARSPAVDPVMGISIDDLPYIPPHKNQGYDFTGQRAIATMNQNTQTDSFPILLSFLFLVFPLSILLILKLTMPQSKKISLIQNDELQIESEKKAS